MADPRVTAVLTAKDEASAIFDRVKGKAKGLADASSQGFKNAGQEASGFVSRMSNAMLAFQIKLELLKKAVRFVGMAFHEILNEEEMARFDKNLEKMKGGLIAIARTTGIQDTVLGYMDWWAKYLDEAKLTYQNQDPAVARAAKIAQYQSIYEKDIHRNDALIQSLQEMDAADSIRDMNDALEEMYYIIEQLPDEAQRFTAELLADADKQKDFFGGVTSEVKALKDELSDLYSEGASLTKTALGSIRNDWGALFADLGDKITTVGQVVRGMLDSVLQSFRKLIGQLIADQLLRAILSQFGGGQGALGNQPLFGLPSNYDNGKYYGPLAGSYGLSTRASGGPVYPGRRYLVGENGPEPFTPRTAGYITPTGGDGGGGSTIVVYANDAKSFRDMLSREGDFITQAVIRKVGQSRVNRAAMRGAL